MTNEIKENLVEVAILGTIYTGQEALDTDAICDEFILWLESKGWSFLGVVKPLEIND